MTSIATPSIGTTRTTTSTRRAFPSGVIRAGDWKLIEAFETGELSLYNLADDISETNDLFDRELAKASELHDQLKAWRLDVGADPMRPNPEYNEKINE